MRASTFFSGLVALASFTTSLAAPNIVSDPRICGTSDFVSPIVEKVIQTAVAELEGLIALSRPMEKRAAAVTAAVATKVSFPFLYFLVLRFDASAFISSRERYADHLLYRSSYSSSFTEHPRLLARHPKEQ